MGAPPVPPPPSPFAWGTREWISATFGHDFQIACEDGTVNQRFSSADEAWEVYTQGFGPVKALAASLDASRREELRNTLIKWLMQFQTDLGIAMPLDYLVTVGHRV
jgi:hypothetical protein